MPSVDAVLRTPAGTALQNSYEHKPLVRITREVLDGLRQSATSGAKVPDAEEVAALVARAVTSRWLAQPRVVINATGVVLHTNVGRAPLSEDAVRAMQRVAAYTDLEYDVTDGDRGSRQSHVRSMLKHLTGAEAAYVTVNGASAVALSLAALARGKEVIVSRGQAVEIGGGFRIPVILRETGARLVEVGTTNRTRIEDFAEAITSKTAAILHVHTSNFRVIGFTEQAPLSDLARLARARGLLLLDDNGSGALVDTHTFGLAHEPTPLESLEAGSDVVTFSGDKLLGGPQSGIVLGRNDAVDRIARHPLARLVRPDKTAIAALNATLLAYLRGDAARVLPIWLMIGQSADDIRARAEAMQLNARQLGVHTELRAGESSIGGGSLPGASLPTTLLALPREITASRLRLSDPPVIARSQQGRTLLDLRTVAISEEPQVLNAVIRAAQRVDASKSAVLDSSTND